MASFKFFVVIITLVINLKCIQSAPVMVLGYDQYRNPVLVNTDTNHPKMIWSVSDLISSISWLPIEVNVPDTISNIGSGISGIVQMIPIFNRMRPQGQPRPYKYGLFSYEESSPSAELYSTASTNQLKVIYPEKQVVFKNSYNPFDDYQKEFPTYP